MKIDASSQQLKNALQEKNQLEIRKSQTWLNIKNPVFRAIFLASNDTLQRRQRTSCFQVNMS